MNRRYFIGTLCWTVFPLTAITVAQTTANNTSRPVKGKLMHATGTFEVRVVPVEPSDIARAADTGRMTIDKTWTGALTGTSKGEMLTGMTKENASMAYVAMERFTGTVNGHAGTLLFAHTAMMLHGKPRPEDLVITVVQGSGTGALQGITGTLGITMDGGTHSYDLAYTLPGQQ